jgi:hypothetical protein
MATPVLSWVFIEAETPLAKVLTGGMILCFWVATALLWYADRQRQQDATATPRKQNDVNR